MMLSHKVSQSTQLIQKYQQKIQALNKEMITEPETQILAVLVDDYIKTFPGKSSFAQRLHINLAQPDFVFLVELNQYLQHKHATKQPQITEFSALLIAYFYYYGDYYLYESSTEILNQYPALNQYLFEPLRHYKDRNNRREIEAWLNCVCNNQATMLKQSAFKLLAIDANIPSKMIPSVVEKIVTKQEQDPDTNVYQLLLTYDDTKTPRLRFLLSEQQQLRLSQALQRHVFVSKNLYYLRKEMFHALFLVTPAQNWRAIVATFLDLPTYPKLLGWVLTSPLGFSKEESLIQCVLKRLISCLNDSDFYTSSTAQNVVKHCHKLAPHYYLEIVRGVLTQQYTTTFESFHFDRINPNDSNLIAIKKIILNRILRKNGEILYVIPSLAPLLNNDAAIAEALRNVVRNIDMPLTMTMYVSNPQLMMSMHALASLDLDNNMRTEIIAEWVTVIPFVIFSYIANQSYKSLNALCRTLAHYQQIFNYLQAQLENPDARLETKVDAILLFSNFKFPDSFAPHIVTLLQPYMDDPTLWSAIVLTLAHIAPSQQHCQAIVTRLLLVLHNQTEPLRPTFSVIKKYYPMCENKNEIVQALINQIDKFERGTKDIAFATLAELQLSLEASLVQPMLSHLMRCFEAWTFFSKVQVTNVTASFLDDMLHYLILYWQFIGYAACDIIVNLTPTHLIPTVVKSLINLINDNNIKNNEILYVSLCRFPIPGDQAFRLLNHLIAIPANKYNHYQQIHLDLFAHLMGNLSYASRISVVIAFESALDNRKSNYGELRSFIDDLKNKYLYLPLQIKSFHFSNVQTLPDEMVDAICTYTRN